MAEWQRKSIADGGTYSEIAEQGKTAITTVQSVLKVHYVYKNPSKKQEIYVCTHF